MTQVENFHPTLKTLCEQYLPMREGYDQAEIVRCLSNGLRENPIALSELPPAALRENEDTYARNRLYRCPQSGIVFYVMVWRPGQGSPAHDHGGVWGIVSCLGGKLSVIEHEIVSENITSDHAELRELRTIALEPGSIGITCSPGHEIHSVYNYGPQTAYSLHVYSEEIRAYRVFDLEHDIFETRVTALNA